MRQIFCITDITEIQISQNNKESTVEVTLFDCSEHEYILSIPTGELLKTVAEQLMHHHLTDSLTPEDPPF